MTKSSEILDDDAIAELAARDVCDHNCTMLTPTERDALCQTVRELKAENERLTSECEGWKRRATAQSTRNDEMLTDFTRALKKL